ncbi:DNA-binding transcriptional LysR family regulator [Salirhabdus euzebyi]|uniref:DNA-binding transcriptional LysR family regulator n=1 Tax=Salirhabdus euzebyi TaxID=394506 RepID=A0A841QAF2_9BACI|nr:LysR family transcriptional regulator [Salirhabdus euzebyi]MBB6455376.1 DNA-binding transcriptional LysR family regulator [Salirhabdus euzebyi]
MTIHQVQVLLKVIEYGNITRASEQLGYTQSAVSQMINGLETELGVKLLNRNRKGVTLTRIGEKVVTHYREINRIWKCISDEVNMYQGLDKGQIRIGTVPSIAAKVLPKLIGVFKKKYPNIELLLFEGNSESIVTWLNHSEIDIGIYHHLPANLYFSKILDDQLFVCLPKTHPSSDQQMVTISEIIDSCFIMPNMDCDQLITEVFDEHGFHPNIKYKIQDISTILTMVKEGIGLTILPELSIPDTIPNVSICPLNPKVERVIGVAVKDPNSLSPIVAEFYQHVRNLIYK